MPRFLPLRPREFALAQAQPASTPATVPSAPKETSFVATSAIGLIAGALTGGILGLAFGVKSVENTAAIGAGAGFVAANLAKII